MGCCSSQTKKTPLIDPNAVVRHDTGGTRTQRVLNSWDVTTPIPAPYPQGKVDLTKMLHTDSYEAGTVYDPNPEVVPFYVEGEYVPVKEFYSITPVQPITRRDINGNEPDVLVVNEKGRVINTNSSVVVDRRQKEVLFA